MSVSQDRDRKRKRSESIEEQQTSPLLPELLVLSTPPAPADLSTTIPYPEILRPGIVSSDTDTRPGVRLPLTLTHLRHHDMASSSNKGSKAKSSENSQPRNFIKIRDNLLQQHIHVNHPPARKQFDEVIQMAQAIVNKPRPTLMTPGSEKRLRRTQELYGKTNEDSFLTKFWSNKLVKDIYTRTIEGSTHTVDASLDEDGILGILNMLFHKDCLPLVTNQADYVKEKTDANTEWRIPKPDIAYGFDQQELDLTDEQEATLRNHVDLYKVCAALLSIFFLVEFKSVAGTLDIAEIQGSRGGAAVVSASRQLDILAGLTKDKESWDTRSICFSLAIRPGASQLSVHWIQVQDGGALRYHSHRLDSVAPDSEGGPKRLRQIVENILDWGHVTKRDQLLETLNTLIGKNEWKEPTDDEQAEDGAKDETSGAREKRRRRE